MVLESSIMKLRALSVFAAFLFFSTICSGCFSPLNPLTTPLNTDASTDSASPYPFDVNPTVVSNQQGTWMAFWAKVSSSTGSASYVFSSKNVDNGVTWSSPFNLSATFISAIPNGAIQRDEYPATLYDSGYFYLFWARTVVLPGGTISSSDIFMSKTNGSSWVSSRNVTKQTFPANFAYKSSTAAIDPNGNTIMASVYNASLVVVATSANSGGAWGAGSVMNISSPTHFGVSSIRLAYANGKFLVVYTARNSTHADGIYATVSSNRGNTWSVPIQASRQFSVNHTNRNPDLTFNGTHFVMVWETSAVSVKVPSKYSPIGVTSYSSDGVSWSSPVVLNPLINNTITNSRGDTQLSVTMAGDLTCVVYYTGNDTHALTLLQSHDSTNYFSPVVLNPSSLLSDVRNTWRNPKVAFNGIESVIVVYEATVDWLSSGTFPQEQDIAYSALGVNECQPTNNLGDNNCTTLPNCLAGLGPTSMTTPITTTTTPTPTSIPSPTLTTPTALGPNPTSNPSAPTAPMPSSSSTPLLLNSPSLDFVSSTSSSSAPTPSESSEPIAPKKTSQAGIQFWVWIIVAVGIATVVVVVVLVLYFKVIKKKDKPEIPLHPVGFKSDYNRQATTKH